MSILFFTAQPKCQWLNVTFLQGGLRPLLAFQTPGTPRCDVTAQPEYQWLNDDEHIDFQPLIVLHDSLHYPIGTV